MDNSEGFSKVSFATIPSGVYLLLRRGEVVYAGKSLNVFSRVSDHHRNMQRERMGKPNRSVNGSIIDVPIFDEFRYKLLPKGELDKAELALIQQYLPKHNHHMNRPDQTDKYEALRKSPFFSKFMQKEQARQARMPMKKRRLPPAVARVEADFQTNRDPRMKVTLPKLKCLEDELTN